MKLQELTALEQQLRQRAAAHLDAHAAANLQIMLRNLQRSKRRMKRQNRMEEAMKCYRRWRPTGEVFYIDEKGNVVDEKTATQHLVNESARTTVLESKYQPVQRPTTSTTTQPAAAAKPAANDALQASARSLGLSAEEAAVFVRGRKPGGSMSEAEADQVLRARTRYGGR